MTGISQRNLNPLPLNGAGQANTVVEKNGRSRSSALLIQSKADICAAAALRSSVWPGLSTGRSKGFQASPTICS